MQKPTGHSVNCFVRNQKFWSSTYTTFTIMEETQAKAAFPHSLTLTLNHFKKYFLKFILYSAFLLILLLAFYYRHIL